MPRSAREYLKHILDETSYLMESSRGISKERFLEDPMLQRAFVRSIEIIGRRQSRYLTRFARSILRWSGAQWGDEGSVDPCVLWCGL